MGRVSTTLNNCPIMRIPIFILLCLVFFGIFCDRANASQTLISGVPNYDQDIFPIDNPASESGDCTPVACAMLNGYYDAHGWPRLIPYGSNDVTLNAWGIDTVVRKYKAQLGYNPVTGTPWSLIAKLLNVQGNAIVSVVQYFEPNAAFNKQDDDNVSWSQIQSYLNAGHPCVLSVWPAYNQFPYYHNFNDGYKWEGASVTNEIGGGHTVCAVGWSDVSGHWVICNMGWDYIPHAWFNCDSDDDWYISQITPGGFTSGEDDDAYEDNDTIYQAPIIYAGTISNLRCLDTMLDNAYKQYSRGDWYKINVSAGQSLSISTSFTSANGDLDLAVFDPQTHFIVSSEGSGNSENVSVAAATTGYYYIFVYGYNNAKNQNYSLTVSVVSPPSAISLSCSALPNSGAPGFPFTVSGTATYNNGGGSVAVGTVTITVGGQSYTAAIANGSYSRSIFAPTSPGSYTVALSVADGVGRSGSTSTSVTVNSNGSTLSYTINNYLTCKSCDNADPWLYQNAIDAFGSDDSQFYVWWEMTGITDAHSLYMQLYRPDGTFYGQTSTATFGQTGWHYDWWRGYSYWQINGYDISALEGVWTVKLFVDGSYKQTINFTLRYQFKEHQMCKDHQATSPNDPINPTSIFYQTDVKAETWSRLDKVSNSIEMKWQWYEPNGSQYITNTYTSGDPNASGYDYWDWSKFWGNINIQGNSAANKCGNWYVDVYIKDAFGNWIKKYTDYFQILESPAVAPACSSANLTPNPIPGQAIALNVIATDNTYLKNVVLYWKDISQHSTAWNNVLAGSLNQNYNIGSFAAGQQVEYWAAATDTSGNTMESSHQTLLIRATVIRPTVNNVRWTNSSGTISVPTQVGYNYTLEYKNSLSDATWTSVNTVSGNGGAMTLTDPSAGVPKRFYRVRVQ